MISPDHEFNQKSLTKELSHDITRALMYVLSLCIFICIGRWQHGNISAKIFLPTHCDGCQITNVFANVIYNEIY